MSMRFWSEWDDRNTSVEWWYWVKVFFYSIYSVFAVASVATIDDSVDEMKESEKVNWE